MLKHILQFHLSIGYGKPKFPLKNNKGWKDKNKKHNQKIVSHNDSFVASILKIEINKGINYELVSNCHQVFCNYQVTCIFPRATVRITSYIINKIKWICLSSRAPLALWFRGEKERFQMQRKKMGIWPLVLKKLYF